MPLLTKSSLNFTTQMHLLPIFARLISFAKTTEGLMSLSMRNPSIFADSPGGKFILRTQVPTALDKTAPRALELDPPCVYAVSTAPALKLSSPLWSSSSTL